MSFLRGFLLATGRRCVLPARYMSTLRLTDSLRSHVSGVLQRYASLVERANRSQVTWTDFSVSRDRGPGDDLHDLLLGSLATSYYYTRRRTRTVSASFSRQWLISSQLPHWLAGWKRRRGCELCSPSHLLHMYGYTVRVSCCM